MRNQRSSSSSPSKFPFIEQTPKGLYLRIRLQPRSSRNSVEGVQDNALKIKITAPPVEGEANKALIEYLSKLIGVKKSSLQIDSGEKSKDKRVKVDGVSLPTLEEIFEKVV